MWAINILLAHLPFLPTDDLKSWFDLPTEKEARFVAKRVAEDLFGAEAVSQHIAKMIDTRLSDEDTADWQFIQGINCRESYDLRRDTVPIVNKYKHALKELQSSAFAQDKYLSVVNLDFDE